MGRVRFVPRTRQFQLAALVLTFWAVAASAQICGTTSATPMRVANLAGVDALLAAVNCTDGTVEAVWAGAIALDEPLVIGPGTFLSISGEDDLAEVLGGSQVRLFDIAEAGRLALAQLKLSGGIAESGGAIYSSAATISIDDCVFEGNTASGGNGGAVWARGGELTIIGGEFVGNSASEGVDEGSGNGGAVWASEAGLVVQGTLFEGNRAEAEGGGLFCDVAEDSTDATSGAVSCSFSEVVFASNWAQQAGGALYGGEGSIMAIDGCTFEDNITPGDGGAVVAASATLGGDTVVKNNTANGRGGGVFGRNWTGTIEFNDVLCSQNTAVDDGGCFYSAGRGTVTNGTTMEDNVSGQGGCIYAGGNSDTVVDGGQFTGCRSNGNGAFMFASDGALVTIRGGTVKNSEAVKRAGVVYCDGNSNNLGGSKVTIEGGTFTDNVALEMGGAIVAWGRNDGKPTSMVVTVTGGVFVNNAADFFGGFVFLEEQASLSCAGATVVGNTAGDQGGAIYAREAKWVNSSCDLNGNVAPVGAAAYLTKILDAANFENHSITHSLAGGESAVYVKETSLFAKEVDFQSDAGLQETSTGPAVELAGATLVAEGCTFRGWAGDTVILNPDASGSLALDSCDFSQSSAAMVVSSPGSDAEIRNAFVGDLTTENAVVVNGTLALVDRAMNCDDPGACGEGGCIGSALGVLCECLQGGDCLEGGGALSVKSKTPPPDVTYYPDYVGFELLISAAAEGTTPVIWEVAFETDSLTIQAFPSSGILPPGEDVTVKVIGTSLRQDVAGEQAVRFDVSSLGSDTSDSITVVANFFFCRAYEYAAPPVGDGDGPCESCVVISGAEGVDCELPGATLAALPIRQGYWRSSNESLEIHSCLHSDACVGATRVSGSDDYCREGYSGPYCAVCTDGFGTGADNTCYSCTDVKARWLIFAGSLFALTALLFLIVAVAFLVGGLDAVDEIRRSVPRTRGRSVVGLALAPPVRESSFPARRNSISSRGSGRGLHVDDPVGPALNAQGKGASGTPGKDSPGFGVSSRESTRFQDITAAPPEAVPGCCGFWATLKRWASRVPLTKLKILVVIWQILTVFPSISSVDFPPLYSHFLSRIDFVNFDVGAIVSASCILPGVSFYHRLLLTTLGPLALALVLVLTFQMAKRRSGIGSTGVTARRMAWSRHMAAGLLLTFLVFTSTSTIVFKTFACDEEAVEGESYLRADYSVSCDSTLHMWFMVYAGIMIVVYPVGIPLLYAYILWKNRDALNPRLQTDANAGEHHDATSGSTLNFLPKSDYLTKESLEELNQKLEKRMRNPNLVPSMFLWKDFGASMYYFEVVDCGRRILLTGVLIFIQPNTPEQAAVACIFAFASLLGFELLRPHLDPMDSWIYRLGCVVIFLSNFLALLIKVDSAEGQQTFLGGILVAVNVLLFLAILLATWFATKQAVEDHRAGENAVAVAGTMLTFELKAAVSSRSMREQAAASGWSMRE